MRVGFSLLLALSLFSNSLIASPASSSGPDSPIVIYRNRGVSVGKCVAAVVVAGAIGMLVGNYWKGQQRPEFLNGALRPLVSDGATFNDLNIPNRAVVISAEKYFVEAEGITHISGAVLPNSKDTIAVAALANLLIRQDSAGFLHAFNPITQKWIPILDKPVKEFKTALRNFAALDNDGNLYHFRKPFHGNFIFHLEGTDLSPDFDGLKLFDRGKFKVLLSLDGLTLLATDVSDPDHRRVYIMNDDGHNILQQENRGANRELEEMLRQFEQQQRRQDGEAPQA